MVIYYLYERILNIKCDNILKHNYCSGTWGDWQEGLSISEIEITMGINWRTTKNYADEDQLPKQNHLKRKG